MSLITAKMAQGWVETTKFRISELDTDLLDQIETETLGRISSTYDTTTWITPETTPKLVRVAIAKAYAAWAYRRAYSEDEGIDNEYATNLLSNSEMLIQGIIDGIIELPDPAVNTTGEGSPLFYPTDLSSEMEATIDDPSLGPANFSMGMKF